MNTQVTVIDYGSGNLHSVIKALRESGAELRVTDEPTAVRDANRLVLPGVGAFADGMEALERRNLVPALLEFFATERPFLGICLGMQMLLTESEEFGVRRGLGVIPGRVVKIPGRPGFKVPHVGWSKFNPGPGGSWDNSLLADTPLGTRAYFVHSFSATPENEDDWLAVTDYGGFRIAAAVRRRQCDRLPVSPGEERPRRPGDAKTLFGNVGGT